MIMDLADTTTAATTRFRVLRDLPATIVLGFCLRGQWADAICRVNRPEQLRPACRLECGVDVSIVPIALCRSASEHPGHDASFAFSAFSAQTDSPASPAAFCSILGTKTATLDTIANAFWNAGSD